MATISESQLATWIKPAYGNEGQKAKDTESMIRTAIHGHDLLKTLSIDVYAKGSYRNNTNVRRDSDVDIAVEYTGINFSEYGPDTNRETVWRERGLVTYVCDRPISDRRARLLDHLGIAVIWSDVDGFAAGSGTAGEIIG